jgi:hypothetical protein
MEFSETASKNILNKTSSDDIGLDDCESPCRCHNIEKLLMELEDYYSLFINRDYAYRYYIGIDTYSSETFNNTRNSNHQTQAYKIECQLSQLHQLKDDLENFIKSVESNCEPKAKIKFGDLDLDIKVTSVDTLYSDKSQISQEFSKVSLKDYTDNFVALPGLFQEYFKTIESDSYDCYISNSSFFKIKINPNIKFITEYEKRLESNLKSQLNTKINELEWEIQKTKSKKANWSSKLKALEAKENDLQRFSKNISDQTVKIAKEKEALEYEIESFERIKYSNSIIFNQKVEYINETLKVIEDAEYESLLGTLIGSNSSQDHLKDDTKALENQLKKLENEFRFSKFPENIESLQTNINRVKNSLLNLKSLDTLQKTERTSSIIRNNISKIEKNLDTSTDCTVSRTSFVSNHSDTPKSKPQKIFHHPLPASIRNSPLKKLEIATPIVKPSELTGLSKRQSPFPISATPKNSADTNKYNRVKEQILREREEDLETEELKLQSIWMNVPEGKLMIPLIQNEISEYRNLKKDLLVQKELIEKEKSDLRERFRSIEASENETKEIKADVLAQQIKFEKVKKTLFEKLEWLKNMLIEHL